MAKRKSAFDGRVQLVYSHRGAWMRKFEISMVSPLIVHVQNRTNAPTRNRAPTETVTASVRLFIGPKFDGPKSMAVAMQERPISTVMKAQKMNQRFVRALMHICFYSRIIIFWYYI